MKKQTLFWLFLIFAISIVAVVAMMLEDSGKNILPETFGELKIARRLSEGEAANMINHLHGKGVTPEHNEVIFYEASSGTATLYASVYRNANEAWDAEARMARLIKNGNPMFGLYRQFSQRGLVVHRCFGLDQEHYFFASKKRLYWLAVDPQIAQSSLDAFLEKVVD